MQFNQENINPNNIVNNNINNDIKKLQFIWSLVCYGGAIKGMDPGNKNTACDHRDAACDITLLSVFDENDKIAEREALRYMKKSE